MHVVEDLQRFTDHVGRRPGSCTEELCLVQMRRERHALQWHKHPQRGVGQQKKQNCVLEDKSLVVGRQDSDRRWRFREHRLVVLCWRLVNIVMRRKRCWDGAGFRNGLLKFDCCVCCPLIDKREKLMIVSVSDWNGDDFFRGTAPPPWKCLRAEQFHNFPS